MRQWRFDDTALAVAAMGFPIGIVAPVCENRPFPTSRRSSGSTLVRRARHRYRVIDPLDGIITE